MKDKRYTCIVLVNHYRFNLFCIFAVKCLTGLKGVVMLNVMFFVKYFAVI